MPLTQNSYFAQAFAQPPQLAVEVSTSTHVLLHALVSLAHRQAPAEQTLPAPQTVPQAPQLVASEARVEHTPPHSD